MRSHLFWDGSNTPLNVVEGLEGLKVIKSRNNHSWDVPKTRFRASGSLFELLRPSEAL